MEEVPGKCLENEMSEAGSGNPRVFLISFIYLFIHSVFTDTHLGQAPCWAPGRRGCRRNISGLRRLALFRGDPRRPTIPRRALTECRGHMGSLLGRGNA